MKKFLLAFIFMMVILNLIAQEFPKYEMELVKEFKSGKGQNELGNAKGSPSDNGPSAFSFDKEGNLYISDILNRRLVKYDKNNSYIKEFKSGYSPYARMLYINEYGDFIIHNFSTMAIDDISGNKKTIINLNKSKFKQNIKYDTDFIYKNNVVYFHLNDGTLVTIPNPGLNNEENLKKMLVGEDAKNYIKTRGTTDITLDTTTLEYKPILRKDNEILTHDYETYYGYWKSRRSKGLQKSSFIKDDLKNKGFTDNYLERLKKSDITYIGKDNDKNIYWKLGQYILVFNNQGQLIGVFEFDWKKSKTYPAVNPSGDVYFLSYDGEKNYLWRVKRKW